MLIIQKDILSRLCSHAETEYPKECCGILLGKRLKKSRIAYKVVSAGNETEESQSTTHFTINPLALFKIEQAAEKENLEIVGFYHSHPDCEAVASKEDICHMMAGYSYPIISVRNGICVTVRSFEKVTPTDQDAVEEKMMAKEK